ncbi:MAG: NAD(P)/FAD-dependent oxidoreductase [Chitinispirillaceae bacterium]
MTAVMEKNLRVSSPDQFLVADSAAKRKHQKRPVVETVDVVVIGAGVAGSYLASLLSGSGMNVVLLERDGDRSCVGNTAVSKRTLRTFPFLSALEKKGESGLEIVSKKGRVVNVPGTNHGLRVFPRAELESFLLRDAFSKGAMNAKESVVSVTFKRGSWTVRTQNHTLNCRFLVGADGWDSMVRREIVAPFAKEDLLFGAGYIARTRHDEKVQIRFLPGGEVLKLLEGGQKSSVGVFGHVRDIRKTKNALNQIVRLSLGAIQPLSPWAVYLPCPSDGRHYSLPCSGKNWLLIGEAAGHVNPLSLEGIHYELWSAQLASQALIIGEPRLFDSMWHDEYGRELEAALQIRNRLTRWESRTEWCFAAANRSRVLKGFLTDLFSEGIDQKKFWSRLCRGVPLSVLELAGVRIK